ncbi:MAG TPA: PIN domain-containing protein [Chloroflexota bacterium]|nr:PIN domain-containing protein [Chloroflexota bacterium]
MTALLDTNVLVHHFTGAPPDQAQRATAFLRAAERGELILVDLVAAELVFVLQSVYRQPRATVARLLRAVLALPAVRCDHSRLLHRTIELYAGGRDFTDAYLVATAEAAGISDIVSFDRGLRNLPSVGRIEP